MDWLMLLLGPVIWISRLYTSLLLSDLWPQSWVRRIEAMADRTAGWSWKGRLGVLTAIIGGGLALWLVVGLALTIAVFNGWLSFLPAFVLATICAYLLVGGSIGAVTILVRGLSRR